MSDAAKCFLWGGPLDGTYVERPLNLSFTEPRPPDSFRVDGRLGGFPTYLIWGWDVERDEWVYLWTEEAA